MSSNESKSEQKSILRLGLEKALSLILKSGGGWLFVEGVFSLNEKFVVGMGLMVAGYVLIELENQISNRK